MKNLTKLTFAAVASLSLTATAMPAVAQQTQMHHGKTMGGHSGTGGHGGMAMMMGGSQSHMMSKFDTDKDGKLSPEEMSAGIQTELKTYDADANGTLSLDEFATMQAAHTRPMTVRAFQMHDPDGDAQISESEMAAMAEMMQSHIGGKHDGMREIRKEMMDDD